VALFAEIEASMVPALNSYQRVLKQVLTLLDYVTTKMDSIPGLSAEAQL